MKYHFLPNESQELLLKAALLKGPSSLEAWTKWKSRADIDKTDQGSFRIMPLVYRNLEPQGVQDAVMGKLKGIYRYTWAKNRLLFENAAAVMRIFRENGIQTLLLKGASLALLTYKDKGIRPMDDVDILVPFSRAQYAVDLLVQEGWKQVVYTPKIFIPSRSGSGFIKGVGQSLDLHWHALHQGCEDDADQTFWDRALPVDFQGIPTLALCPTDQLFLVCVHGARWCPLPPIRWVADAMELIRDSSAPIQWDRLTAHAEKFQLSIPLRETLKYLRERMEAPIPRQVEEDLLRSPSAPWEEIEFASESRPQKWLRQVPVLWSRYPRSKESKRYRFKPYGFLKYLQNYCGLDRLWQVPGFLLAKRFQRFKQRSPF